MAASGGQPVAVTVTTPAPPRLSHLAAGFERRGNDPLITGVSEDSRRITTGMLFVAVRGSAADGHRYIPQALDRGAAAIAAERLDAVPSDVPAIRVPSGRRALNVLAGRFFREPARELNLVGFTGTFGKTSTSDVLRQLLNAGGIPAGVVGSLGARYGHFHDPGSGLTTPAPPELHRMLRDLRSVGAETVIMEVTSHALKLERIAGLRFDAGLLAAIKSGEHTDFHGTYQDYVAAKRLFLDYLNPDVLLAYDADNDASRGLAAAVPRCQTVGFSLEGAPADLQFTNVRLDEHGARFTVAGTAMREAVTFRSSLLGSGHLRNVALALTYALAAGVQAEVASDVLRTLQPLQRRMERYVTAGRTILDDTAAHPESLEATFDVAAMLPKGSFVVVYAVRGMRGVDINARNAEALVELARVHAVKRLILTAAADATGPQDRVTPDEADAARRAVARRASAFDWHDTLRGATDAARRATSAGDLIVLAGAQGMNRGREMLEQGVSEPAIEPTRSAPS